MENVHWERAETLMLIALYKKFPLLYQTSHPDYLKQIKTARAFELISDEMQEIKAGVTPKQVKKKIILLLQQLEYEKANFLEAVNAGTPINKYKSALWCFTDLKFLWESELNSDKSEINSEQLTCEIEPSSIQLKRKHSSIDAQNIPMKHLNRDREIDSSLQALHKCTRKSLDLLATLVKRSEEQRSKEEQFCSVVCGELKELKQPETYDAVTLEILTIVRRAKARERQTEKIALLLGPPINISNIRPNSALKEDVKNNESNLNSVCKVEPEEIVQS